MMFHNYCKIKPNSIQILLFTIPGGRKFSRIFDETFPMERSEKLVLVNNDQQRLNQTEKNENQFKPDKGLL